MTPNNQPLAMDSKVTWKIKPQANAWLVVALLCVVGALNYLDRIMITTMRSSIIEDMTMTDAQFGLLTSVFLWVYGILSPFAGFLADKFNRSKVIIVSLFVWSLVTWLTSYASSFEELLATRALMGISEACYIPAALALIADYHKGPTRSLATGIHMAGVFAGQSLGFIGGWVAENHDWTYAFSICGIFGIIYSFILAFTLRDAPLITKEKISVITKIGFFKGVRDLFSNRSFIFMILFWGIVSLVSWTVVGWLPTYYKEHFSLSQSLAGLYATGYIYPASIIGLLLGGFLSDRWSVVNPKGRILIPVFGLLLAAPSVFFAADTYILSTVIFCFIIYAVTKSFCDANAMPILCLVVDPNYRATAYGILNLFGCLLGGIGLYVSGVLRDYQIDLEIIYKSAALFLLLGAALLFMVKPRFKEL